MQMYEQVKKNSELFSHRVKSCLAAFLWLATKEFRIPAFVDEIAEAYEVDPRDLLNVSSSTRLMLDLTPSNVQATSYIERLQKVLLFSDDILRKANEVAVRFPDLSGKRP